MQSCWWVCYASRLNKHGLDGRQPAAETVRNRNDIEPTTYTKRVALTVHKHIIAHVLQFEFNIMINIQLFSLSPSLFIYLPISLSLSLALILQNHISC